MVNGHVEDKPSLREDVEEVEQQPGKQQIGHLAPQTGVTAIREDSVSNIGWKFGAQKGYF